MRFTTTILEKTVILCAQVYLLAITLMILGLRWWQTMAMKDFQTWVLATCSLPSLPALDTLDEAILSPSLPAFQHSRHSSSSTHNWMMWGPTPHLISKAILHVSAEGPTRESRWLQGVGGWGITWTALVQLHPGLRNSCPFPAWSTTPVFIPTQERASGCLAEGARFGGIYRTLAGKFAGTGAYGALLPHLEWELRPPDHHINEQQILWVSLPKKHCLDFETQVVQRSAPGCGSHVE